MLFNSHEFIFVFLPAVFAGFFLAARLSTRLAAAWLCVASLAFYAWWSPIYSFLLLGSVSVNYLIGREIGVRVAQERMLIARHLLFGGIAINLVGLGYFKYMGFFVQTVGSALHVPLVVTVILPLGISFYTFTQLAYLVDVYRGKVAGYDPVHYALFVTYFPHLIAGPILHHNEMIPQFERPSTYRFSYENISVGMTIFFIGLFKKVVLADGIAPQVGPIFDAAAAGVQLTFLEAWIGALCYSFQLYFDFSGYCDMAIGISRLFGIALPLNFHSPYKAVNIIEFWRRWHMTLSRFLRDYLYIPLGGSRTTLPRRYVNVMVTMLLGGLWHGAGWTFILWGGLHGLYVVANHAWHALLRLLGQDPTRPSSFPIHVLSVFVTFMAVTFAWAMFRASDLSSALSMTIAMAGGRGISLPPDWINALGATGGWLLTHQLVFAADNGLIKPSSFAWIAGLAALCWLAPNTQQIMRGFNPALPDRFDHEKARLMVAWKPSLATATLVLMVGIFTIVSLTKRSEFLYFQF